MALLWISTGVLGQIKDLTPRQHVLSTVQSEGIMTIQRAEHSTIAGLQKSEVKVVMGLSSYFSTTWPLLWANKKWIEARIWKQLKVIVLAIELIF